MVKIENRLLAELTADYESIIMQVVQDKYGENAERVYTPLLEWLRSTDFYVAPASTQYHDSVVGGLLIHSLNVYNNVMMLVKAPQFNGVDPTSAALVALVHDWCKIGLYESYLRNVKNEQTGQWEQVTAWKHNQTGIPLGHGVASMFLASKFFKLTPDEALAIRWHQARWNVCREEMNELQRANEISPLVHLIQFADQLSITDYANKNLIEYETSTHV